MVRSAAVDFGKVRVGLAVSDELGLLAHARPHLDGTNPGHVVDALTKLAAEEGIDVFIVGLPRRLDGSEGVSARRARAFAERLQHHSGKQVILLDERLTTKQAGAQLSAMGRNTREQRNVIDSVSAALLLQTYLDSRNAKQRA
jgi:putative holliday junction resolvase